MSKYTYNNFLLCPLVQLWTPQPRRNNNNARYLVQNTRLHSTGTVRIPENKLYFFLSSIEAAPRLSLIVQDGGVYDSRFDSSHIEMKSLQVMDARFYIDMRHLLAQNHLGFK